MVCLLLVKCQNLAINLFCMFYRGHLNPAGHYWDLLWEAGFASGPRNTSVML